MKIETKYDIGYEFWVPRVMDIHEKETTVIDGVTWYRDSKTLEIKAKHKKVVSIEIKVRPNCPAKIIYRCADYDAYDPLPMIYHPDDMEFTDHDSALEFARYWRETQKQEYYGGGSHCDDI